MKVSISLPDDDVDFLDAYATEHGLVSRSAAVHRAVRLLKAAGLGAAYEEAWTEWAEADEEAWSATAADGFG
jgi:Arc/MetJ-type ribon-helix-helix transcriptional regulator